MTDHATLGHTIPFRILIDDAVKLARKHFMVIYFPVAVPLALMSGIMVATQSHWMMGIFSMRSGVFNLEHMFSTILLLLGMSFLWGLAFGLGAAAMMKGSIDATAGRPVDMKNCWLFVIQPQTIGTLILSGLAIGLGFMFCFFPGVYIGLILSFILPVMVDENLFVTDAMRRSYQLVRYNPHWPFLKNPMVKVFTIFVLGGILSYIANIIIQLPLLVYQQIIIFRAITSGGGVMDPATILSRTIWLQVPSNMFGTMASMAVQVYVCFCIALLFFDVRRRKEGGDIAQAIGELAEAGGVIRDANDPRMS